VFTVHTTNNSSQSFAQEGKTGGTIAEKSSCPSPRAENNKHGVVVYVAGRESTSARHSGVGWVGVGGFRRCGEVWEEGAVVRSSSHVKERK